MGVDIPELIDRFGEAYGQWCRSLSDRDYEEMDGLRLELLREVAELERKAATGEETMEQTLSEQPKTLVEVTDDPITLRVLCQEMIDALRKGKQSRPRSVAITKLEEARMWLEEALRTE